MKHKKENIFLGQALSLGYKAFPLKFIKGTGSTLIDENGNKYIDFCSGTACNSVGHSHPKVIKFMKRRISELWNIHDYSSPYRLPALEKLNQLTPDNINIFQFYSGGSETIEAGIRAIKSVLPSSKANILGFRSGYHGKTLASRNITRWSFPNEQDVNTCQIPFPDFFGIDSNRKTFYENESLNQLEKYIKEENIGVIICESILGAGGGLQASQNYWNKFEAIRKKYGVALFIDEIFTGMGRTGKNFAFEHYNLSPDLIAFAKGIGGGFPAMVLGGKKEIMNSEVFGQSGGASTTFGGNPLSLSSIYITLEIYEREKLLSNVISLEPVMRKFLMIFKERFSFIQDFRLKGLVGAFNIDLKDKSQEIDYSKKLHRLLLENGVFFMTFNNVFRITPPLNIKRRDLENGLQRMFDAMMKL